MAVSDVPASAETYDGHASGNTAYDTRRTVLDDKGAFRHDLHGLCRIEEDIGVGLAAFYVDRAAINPPIEGVQRPEQIKAQRNPFRWA